MGTSPIIPDPPYATLDQHPDTGPRGTHDVVRTLISGGHPTQAFELARAGLRRQPLDRELLYLSSLALARGGNSPKAAEYLEMLLNDPDLDRDLRSAAFSLRGRLAKDRYQRTREASLKTRLAQESAQLYELAHALTRKSFPGINAATMTLLAGEPGKARALAATVIGAAQAELRQPGCGADYWLLATLGEAHLLLHEPDAAVAWYRQAVEQAAGKIGDIAAMRRNLRLLEGHVPIATAIWEAFQVGAVVVAAGHMIDHPTRPGEGKPPRFPADPELERRVGQAIREELERLHAAVGYCSAACGTDLLFAEKMLERGAELHIVLPFDRDDFYRTSVDHGRDERVGWRQRADAVLARAAEIHYATKEKFLGDEVLFEFVNDFMQGLAVLRANQLGIEPFALGVVDPSSARAVGGTVHFLDSWQAVGRSARVIDVAALRGQTPSQPPRDRPNRPAGAACPPRPNHREIKAMLFADVKNFSKLREELTPLFFVHFLNEVAGAIRGAGQKPIFCNTWGDGLYAVFAAVPDAAEFSLSLIERVARVDWQQLGLPADTTVRVGVHAGPVYRHNDPIIERVNFFGSHVNRAARIEPVTLPGCVYASEQFAALLVNKSDHAFACEYIGIEDLAKGYDRMPLYRLSRRE